MVLRAPSRRGYALSPFPSRPPYGQAYTASLRRVGQFRAAVSHLERNQTVQRQPERIACHGCLGTGVGAVSSNKLTMKSLFALGSGLKRNDDRAHGSFSRLV